MAEFPDLDMYSLDRELDRTKSSVFIGSTAAFLGSVMCSLKFIWDRKRVVTAGTDGVSLIWNPDYFLGLIPEARKTDLQHELWHVARMHGPRRGTRCPKYWNVSCDVKIDLDLYAQGACFDGIKGVLSWPDLDAFQYVGWVEEDIYDDLDKKQPEIPEDYILDMQEADPSLQAKIINIVVKAMQQAKMAGPGNMPGDIESLITKFLTPVVPWEIYLHKFMQGLVQNGYSWHKPNQRFSHIYMPSRHFDEGALAHLAYFEDVSGSITEADAQRFNSEFKYVKEEYNPEKMTLIQFDTIIQDERVYLSEDPFDQVEIKGGGGTSLAPVREWIIKHKPTAAVVFSDMYCSPMEPLPFDIPIIWIAISNKEATVPFGQIVHIR